MPKRISTLASTAALAVSLAASAFAQNTSSPMSSHAGMKYTHSMASFATGGYASALHSKSVMHRMDTNHDNMVSRKEWIAFQNRVFTMIDRQKMGEVDASEYASASPYVAVFATGGYASTLLTREMFKNIDTNGDGKISRQEFLRYQLQIFDLMDTSRTHKGLLGPGQFFATGGAPAA
jgi:Ca2+-binding EF-hand superfamily protein